MAGGTDFRIDLQTTLKLLLVVMAERSGKAPFYILRMVDRIMRCSTLRMGFGPGGLVVFLRIGLGDAQSGQKRQGEKACSKLFHVSIPLRAHAVALAGSVVSEPAFLLFCSSTASVIEFGIRRGVSNRPRSGMITRKKPK
ncbi:hypothetical protein D3C87_1790690 [compost metagenome]